MRLKDSELQHLADRITFLERQANSRVDTDGKVDSATDSDSQAALQVKFLRVKGRSSTEIDERTLDEKDDVISRLKLQLADAATANERLHDTQIELRRAWDAMSGMQQALNDERRQHTRTQERLREAAMRIEQDVELSPQNSLGQLPTIEEQDQQELEAMFNAAQQDNLRLYGEVEALEKRVREANARVFASEQASETLREQLKLEKAINDDMETARPSLVHRVHFQRMEGQLKEGREELQTKDDEIKQLRKENADKDAKFEELSKSQETSKSGHSKLQEENERLKKNVKELEATKEQLMLDHERLARQRTRNRTVSGDASARSSATLITDTATNFVIPIPPIPSEEELLLPARPVSIGPGTSTTSIQGTPEAVLRREPSYRPILISNDLPPTELRHKRGKSLTLKGLMRKIARKDDEEAKVEKEEPRVVDAPRPRTAFLPKDKLNLLRPKTAAPQEKVEKQTTNAEERPTTSAAQSAKATKRADHRRYYSESRPKTPGAGEGAGTANGEEQRPKSRGWAAS